MNDGGSAVDAVEAAVVELEDSPSFNAGFGAALNEAGEHELDAAIMDGASLTAGAVTLARRIRNPVKAARAVMARGDVVLLGGEAADTFAQSNGLVIVEPGYFTTERRARALASLKQRGASGAFLKASEAEKHGTVGAVALDPNSNLAAATSTGGFNNKPVGRIGDTPIIGAGTYAKNGVCAVSCTGRGEDFIRVAAAHEVASRLAYLGEDLEVAARHVIFEQIGPLGGGAGLIAVDAKGRISAPFNTVGMYRGWITATGALHVSTHDEILLVERLA